MVLNDKYCNEILDEEFYRENVNFVEAVDIGIQRCRRSDIEPSQA